MNPYLQQQKDAFKKNMQRQQPLASTVAARIEIPPSPTPSTASSITSSRPLNSIEIDRPASLQEIHEKLNFNLSIQPDLLEKVCRNERISFNGNLLRYEPVFAIRSKEDIVQILKNRTDLSGIDIADLKETFPKIEDACLVEQLFAFYDSYGPKVIFYNDFKLDNVVDTDFRQLWNQVVVPADDFELRDYLEQTGLKASNQANGKSGMSAKSQETKKKTATKRPFRKIKITNDYLEGIDLSIDPDQTLRKSKITNDYLEGIDLSIDPDVNK